MKKLIAANWKMNKTVKESISFVKEFEKIVNEKDVDIVICPAFTSLNVVANEIKNSSIKLGAQNMHFEDSGAYTGEISALMLKEIGCEYVILGHSERREIFDENDFLINKKVIAALKNNLKPILCVGENMGQRKNGKTREIIQNQLKNCLGNIDKNQILKINVAYEPIWAISKGNPNHKAATAEDAEEGHKFIRSVVEKMFGKNISKNIRIIYGGSMKPENAKELLGMPNIDGGLVGNASLNAKNFAEIVQSAK